MGLSRNLINGSGIFPLHLWNAIFFVLNIDEKPLSLYSAQARNSRQTSSKRLASRRLSTKLINFIVNNLLLFCCC